MRKVDIRTLDRMERVVRSAIAVLLLSMPSVDGEIDEETIELSEALLSRSDALWSSWSYIRSTCEEVLNEG